MPLDKMLAAIGLCVLSLPTAAFADPRPAFAEPALDEAMLAQVHGTGLVSAPFIKAAARDDWEGSERLSGQILSITLDNWFHDVGAPLIATNLTR